jgi:glycerol-3-phosphate acyltransferase PlsY
MELLPAMVAIVLAYLLGSVSFAVVVSRAMGLADPRSYGSGNPGATNVLRTGNRRAAVLTLIGDAAKGAVAVALATAVAQRYGFGDAVLAGVGLAAFVGHLYPVFHGFQGGKGVATAAGVLLALSPWLGLATLATWIAIAVFFRYSSLAALIAAVFAPAYYALLGGVDAVLAVLVAMGALLVWRHRANVAKLLAGTESRIGAKKSV